MARDRVLFQDFYLDLGLRKLLPEWRKLFIWKSFWSDLVVGTRVALMAIPLSLAIGLASGVPSGAVLTSAVVAGFVCALFGGTLCSVSGPSVAMAILVSSAVQKYGYSSILVIGLVSGLMQILAGILNFGKFIRLVPLPVVSGVTAGIGVIILVMQVPAALGLPTPDQSKVLSVFLHIKEYIGQTQLASLGLSLGTLILVIGLSKVSQKIPVLLIAMGSMSCLAVAFGLEVPSIGIISRELPKLSFSTISRFLKLDLIWTSFIFFGLASLQTLRSSTAVDGIVGGHGHDPSQELIGQGLGNISSALAGGIPIAGLITRSSLNVQLGARTRRPAMIHSIVIFLIVCIFSSWMEKVPVPVLVGILMSMALKMISPIELVNLWKVSKSEASVYFITLVVIVFVDLIAGVQAGIFSSLVILAIRLGQMRSRFHESDLLGPYRFSIQGPVTFMCSTEFEKILGDADRIESGRGVVIDMSRVSTIDSSGAEKIVEIVERIVRRGSRIALQGLKRSGQRVLVASDTKKFIARTFAASESEVHEVLKGSSHSAPIDRLTFGVRRFQEDSRIHYQDLFDHLAESQNPHTLFIACSDSRISPTLITSTDPGELFIVRNVGNIIPASGHDATPAEGAALEFAIEVLGIKEIVVCGHSGCGAMKTIVNRQDLSHLPDLKKWLEGSDVIRSRLSVDSSADDAARVNALLQLENLKTYPIVQSKLEKNEIGLHAWFYDIGPGEIKVWNAKISEFVPMDILKGNKKSKLVRNSRA